MLCLSKCNIGIIISKLVSIKRLFSNCLIYFIQALPPEEGDPQTLAIKYQAYCRSIREEANIYKKLQGGTNFISARFLCETVDQPEPFLALDLCKGNCFR